MRTTIEVGNAHRAALLRLAAERGQKGFSGIVQEALDVYLKMIRDQARKRHAALALRGTLSTREAQQLRAGTVALRKSWR
jgi:hypothetical protein